MRKIAAVALALLCLSGCTQEDPFQVETEKFLDNLWNEDLSAIDKEFVCVDFQDQDEFIDLYFADWVEARPESRQWIIDYFDEQCGLIRG